MNLDPQTPGGARNRRVIKILAGLAAVGVLLGLFGGLLGATAIRALGLDDTEMPPPPNTSTTTATSQPTEEPESSEGDTAPDATREDSKSAADKDKKKNKDKKDKKKPKLNATPNHVSPGERINLTGRIPKADPGTQLQVQRLENGDWDDFPVVAETDDNGSFETWVVTGRTGKMKFRMKVMDGSGKTPPTTVKIG